MNNNIYVTGHRHPDSDAICASLAYTNLLNRTGKQAVSCRQGPLNEETKFILKRFGLENPLLMTDARAKLKDIDLDQPVTIRMDDTVHHAWHVMLENQSRSLYVIDAEGQLVGVCTTSDLSRVRTHPDADLNELMATAPLASIARTIGGKIIHEPEMWSCNGKVFIITLEEYESLKYDLKDSIAMMSSGEEKHKAMLERGIRCLVLTCGQHASEEVIAKAKEKGCAIIETNNNTMHAARIITESYSIERIMTPEVIVFHDDEYVEDAAKKMRNSRVRSYPVLNERNELVGSLTRGHTINYKRRKIALVDHSAVNQSMNNIDKGEIVAIVDHHHIGDIQTNLPIEYRNHRCGCTCTIINTLFKENGLVPEQPIAGIMMSAILSDTLNFRSATTTQEDKDTVKELAKIAGIDDIDAYAAEMLGASVALTASTPSEILNRDLKNYEIGKYKFAIGQTNYSRIDEVQKLLPEFLPNMQAEQQKNRLDLLVMLFTDVLGRGSQFYFFGPLSYVMNSVLETVYDDHSGFDPNIISRKQQMMPKLSEIIKNL